MIHCVLIWYLPKHAKRVIDSKIIYNDDFETANVELTINTYKNVDVNIVKKNLQIRGDCKHSEMDCKITTTINNIN